ncbi:hypothetical protein DFH06DRAFT_140047 [Mycena polygramma]|nr:hypothetical protein DFH06DRAFT_140047 [Mycena polygramma]
MSSSDTSPTLSEAQKVYFLEHGFVHLPQCFSREASAAFTSKLWTRLGMSPDDNTEQTNMPSHTSVLISEFAPKAWSAICELIGGEDRISDETKVWKDSFIVNLGKEGQVSRQPRAGPSRHPDLQRYRARTAICTDGIGIVARHFYKNPNGVTPWMHVRGTPEPGTGPDRLAFFSSIVQSRELASDASFHEMTGEIGDVYLLHPLMVHSASKNVMRTPRVITNPPVTLKAPFRFDRDAGEDYSLLEQKTLRELGFPTGLKGWKIEGEREMIVPRRIRIQAEMEERAGKA